MVKLDKFEIQLTRENENVIYYPGEEIIGNLVVKFSKPQRINEILLKFNGKADIDWSEISGDDNIHYWDYDTIFEFKQYLLEKQSKNDEIYLEAMEYNFPFRFVLPSTDLPTSFDRCNAYIRYWVKATIDIPWSLDIKTIRYFTVINPLDLNLLPGLSEPYCVSDVKNFGIIFKKYHIMIEFNINKTGFVPGETIIFNASIDNRSSKTIKSISAILVQTTTLIYRRSRKHKSPRNIVTLRYDGPKIGPQMQRNWSNVGLKIPALCPSLLDTCHIIKLDYTLRLIVKYNGLMNIGKQLNIPIVLGTVPFSDSKINLHDYSKIEYYRSIVDRNGRTSLGNHKKEYNHQLQYFEPKYSYYEEV